MRLLFATAPGYGLTLPLIPLVWAARAAGHEVLLATTSEMVEVGARTGLPVHDVFPARDVWADLMQVAAGKATVGPDLAEEYRVAAGTGNPFGMFTVTMTEGTIEAGRAFGAELVVSTSDHAAGRHAAEALDLPLLEVGNRISWSTRDADWLTEHHVFGEDEVSRLVQARLGIEGRKPRVLARVDPRAPSMGGLTPDQEHPDPRDSAPWWPMRFVPYNGGTEVPAWALHRPERPRVAVTLGTVVPALRGTSNLAVVIEALGGLDVEVVLAAGTADLTDLGELPANVRSVGFLPLSAFLPTCSAIVHHGGSGTTAAPLFYGVPQLVLPAFADNPMSAQRVADRGVGLRHDPATADVPGIRALVGRLLHEDGFRHAAAEVAAEMAVQPSPASVLDRAVARVIR
ncbi:UDP:flavonoid glycosyltransferase YjiC (YdhE family) [Crossiella equi]|uniref:UDP:flavonoid glycosyltransferase YjiC (YdhE family) n=1 Tax=Crossiella equi TaxID=130796 RepID=A0ABS5A5T6_9PSEU|nr:nucleotide disphospho-sugar-binding domain-containing protein [Crossiella equi]MBP2471973.1 UDP:flavonoid glycosyltransferase YjiC (YdhE family) [Crossiella equi]